MTKAVQSKIWWPYNWADGTKRSYAEPAPVTTKHWNPGNYVFPDHNGTPEKDPSIIGAIDALNAQSGNQYVRGVQVTLPWARIEPTLGNYNFAVAYDWITRITQSGTNGKRVSLSVNMGTYSGGIPTTPQNASVAIIPDYLIPTYVGAGVYGGVMVKLGVTYARDRLIALMTALANEFGNNVNVECIVCGETSRAFVGETSSQTAAYDNAWNYIATTLAPIYASKKAWLCIENNGLSSKTLTNSLQDTMDLNKIGYGVPDINTFYANPTPPGPAMDSPSGGAQYTTLYKMNFGITQPQDPIAPAYPPNIINSSNLDRRLYTLTKPENQVIRSRNLKNSDVKWYADNWFKATHPVWTLRIGDGGSYYANYYVSADIQSITGTNPIQITLSNNFVRTGDYVSFRSIGGPYSFLNTGGYYLATQISSTVISIPVNGTSLGAWSGYGVCGVRAPEDFSGAGTLAYLCQPGVGPTNVTYPVAG
jgi:hypothetical protein